MPQFLITLTPCRESLPEDATAEEQQLVMCHFNYLREHLAAGSLILAGRTQTRPYRGLAIIEVEDRPAAEAFLAHDPAIQSGVFLGEVQEYSVALIRGKS